MKNPWEVDWNAGIPKGAKVPTTTKSIAPWEVDWSKGTPKGAAVPSSVDVSSIDKEIAETKAAIVQRQQQVAAAKAKEAEDAKYAKEHPILSALRGALTATDDRGVLYKPETIQQGMKPLQQDLAALERRRADSLKQGTAIAAPTAGRVALETGKGLLRGPIKTVEGIASWAGVAGKPGEAIAKGTENIGESAIKALGLEQSPEMQYSGLGQRLGQTAEFVGGAGPLGVAGKLGKVGKAAEVAMLGGMGARQARETMDAYEERTGQQLDQGTRSAVQLGGTIIGTALLLPFKSIFSKVAPETAAAANEQLTGILARVGSGQLAKSEAVAAVKSLLADVNASAVGRTVTKGAIPTGLVMGGIQAGQNALEATYNPERRSLEGLTAGVGEATLMGTLGGAATRGVVEGLQARGSAKRQAMLDNYLEQKASEQETEGADYGTFDVLTPDAKGKVQRESLKVVSEPDENGIVTVQHADGTRSQRSLAQLETSHAPAGSIRSVPLPDTMSRQGIAERLRNSLGNFEPDEHLDAFIKKTADHVADAVTLGRPEAPESYLKEQDRATKAKRKISEESRIGRGLIVDEARKVLNEYTDLVTAPPEGVAPKIEPSATEAVTAPPIETVAPPAIGEVIQNRAQSMREENARRTEMLDRVANDPNAIDKPSAFEDMLDQSGYGKPTPHELAHLHDAMRLAAEHETALNLTNARVEDIHAQEQRQAGAGRVNVIEEHLYDPEVGPRKKIDKINTDLEAAGLEKLSEDEVNRYQAVADAVAAYGPKGERQQKLDEIMANPRIKNKYEAFRKRVGEPNEEEAALLGSGTAAIEAQIKPATEQPGAAPTPPIERGQASGRSEEIAAEAEAANQRLAEAQARAEQSRAEVDRINAEIEAQQAKLDAQPHKGTPAARQAINASEELNSKLTAAMEQFNSDIAKMNEEIGAAEEAPAAEELTTEQPTANGEAKEAPEKPTPIIKSEEPVIVGEAPPKGGLNEANDKAASVSLARNWRMAPWYKNWVFQFGGGSAAENSLLKALGINKLSNKLSVKDRLEMLVTNRNGMIREIRRQFNNPIMKEATRLYKEDGIHMDDISDVLQARAAKQRNAKVGIENGSGMTNAEADAILLKHSGDMPKLRKIIKLHDELRTYMQDLAVDSGLISREKMDEFIAEEPDYTPFKGWAAKGDLLADENTHKEHKPEFVRKGMGVNRNIVRKAEGRSSLAGNSLAHLMADAEVFALKAADNKPARALLDLMEAHPEEMADIASTVPKRGEDTLTAMRDGEAYNIEFKDTDAGNAMRSAFNEIRDPMKRAEWLKKFTKVSAALRGVNTTMSPLFWPKAWWKDSMDAIEFVLSEKGMKDSPLYGKQGVTRATIKYSKPFGDTWHAVFDYLRDAEPKTAEGAQLKQMVADMVEQGGTAGYAFQERAQDIRERMQLAYDRLEAMGKNKAILNTKAGREGLMQVIHGINDFIDMVPRAAVYRAATEAGVAPEAAAKIALDASLNLPRRGRFGTTIDAVKWYTNAGIQSAAKKGRMLQSPNGRKILAGHMALGTAIAMWNMSVAGDKNKDGKNDYLQLPAWRKAMGLTIYSPSGETAITIPLGFMSSFETYFGQKMAEVVHGITTPADGAAALSSAPADIAKGFVSSQLPLGRSLTALKSPLDLFTLAMPDAASPVWGLLLNENAFGEPIYNEPFNKEQAKSSVPRASTGQGYKDWASWLNDHSSGHGKFAGVLDSHAETWKYLVDQYTGGIGKFVGSLAQAKNPFGSQYVVDESKAAQSDYYALSARMRQMQENFGPSGTAEDRQWAKENRPIDSNPRVLGAYKATEHRLDGVKARETNLQKSKASPEQKQIMADKIEADKQEAYASFLRAYNAVAAKQ